MKPISNAKVCSRYQRLIQEMMLPDERLGDEFNLDWVRKKQWGVVPVERAQHFIPEEISIIVSALRQAGYSECVAVATEPLDPLPACYSLLISEDDFREFNRECGLFHYLLTDESRTWAISCTDAYNLFAGPAELVKAMLGRPIKDAWQIYWTFIEQQSMDVKGPLHQAASRYAALQGSQS